MPCCKRSGVIGRSDSLSPLEILIKCLRQVASESINVGFADSCKKLESKLKTDKIEKLKHIHEHINMQVTMCSISRAALCEHRQICKFVVLVMMLSSH